MLLRERLFGALAASAFLIMLSASVLAAALAMLSIASGTKEAVAWILPYALSCLITSILFWRQAQELSSNWDIPWDFVSGDWNLGARIILFGALIPGLILCIDPIVFRGSAPLVPGNCRAVYAAYCVEIATIVATLWVKRNNIVASVLTGILASNALFAAVIGVLLLPFTLLTLPAGIGLLGAAPFVMALVLCQLVVRQRFVPRLTNVMGLLAGAILAFGIPASIWVGQRWLG